VATVDVDGSSLEAVGLADTGYSACILLIGPCKKQNSATSHHRANIAKLSP